MLHLTLMQLHMIRILPALLSLYVYPDTSVGPAQTIISKGNNYASGSNNKFFFSINSGSKVLNSFSNVVLKQWTHIAATYASASGIMRIFINGNQDSAKTLHAGKH